MEFPIVLSRERFLNNTPVVRTKAFIFMTTDFVSAWNNFRMRICEWNRFAYTLSVKQMTPYLARLRSDVQPKASTPVAAIAIA